MTSVFSWQNSVSLCPASFCTPRPNLPVTPGVSWLPTLAFLSPVIKSTSFLGVSSKRSYSPCFSSTYTKIGMIQRRLAWPLRKDDMQIREAFHIFTAFWMGENNRKWSNWQTTNLKNDTMISVRLQGKPSNITVIQVDAPTSNTLEGEVERCYEDLQDL